MSLIILDQLVYVNIELKELLSDEVLDELVVIDQLLVVNLCSAFEFHFLGVILPLDLDTDEGEAYKLQHLLWVTLELDTDIETAWLKLLVYDLLLVPVR